MIVFETSLSSSSFVVKIEFVQSPLKMTDHNSPMVVTRNQTEYEQLRRSYLNADVRDAFPNEIHLVNSIADVQNAICRAKALRAPVGVRSGGHSFSNVSLLHNGILIDTSKLNRKVDYDSITHEISFGPAVRVIEISEALQKLNRFFPHGHAPTVAAGGFTLAGGQGMYMRGWGPTVDQWVTQMEIVTPDGEVRVASRTKHSELFWAARGSGCAFFGVVTKIWGRTIPARKMFAKSILFQANDDNIEALLEFALTTNNTIPKWGTETAMSTSYADMRSPDHQTDAIPEPPRLHFGVFSMAYVDTLTEAKTLLSAWEEIPASLQDHVLQIGPVAEMSWRQFFDLQEWMVPSTPGGNWQINSFLNNPSVPLQELVKAIKPAMCDLPTSTSVGCIYCSDSYPNENDHLCSLPQQYYVSTFTNWKDKSLEPGIREHMADIYSKLYPLGVGMYIADYNPFDKNQAKVSLHTSS